MIDVLIVGSGISGCNLYLELLKRGKSVHMISHGKLASSSVAAGVYNPTVLKRFSPVWNGELQMNVAAQTYDHIENLLDTKLVHPISIWRRLHDAKEAKTWVNKSKRDDLSRFMNSEVVTTTIDGIDSEHGFGEVLETGWLDTIKFMESTIEHAKAANCFTQAEFDHDALLIEQDHISHHALIARHVVFADGFGLLHNPLFNYLPMQGNKGEVLTIKVPGLHLDHIIKSSVFLMPYKEDLFWVGATYNRDDLTYEPTEDGIKFLTSRLERFLKLPYEIVDHKAGIRPTTDDRRPFLGAHSIHKRALVFNGMGSRAVLVAPWAAQLLCDYVYEDLNLPEEICISRFN
jgi:glycine/D-amino acid oxidase-like deaminating enzyme